MALLLHPSTQRPTGTVPAQKSGRMLLQAALVCALFCLGVCGAMLYWHIRAQAEDPLRSPQIIVLKEKLLASPKDESLKEQIRALDLDLRRRYFYQISLNRAGGWLVLGAVITFLVASKSVLRGRALLPMPQGQPNAAEQTLRIRTWARWSVAGIGAALGAALGTLAFATATPLPSRSAEIQRLLAIPSPLTTSTDYARAAEAQQNWPRFRGFDGNGVCWATNASMGAQLQASLAVVWSAEVPVPGFNSPIVWGERIFLAGADSEKREVLCYGLQKGELLWRSLVPSTGGGAAQKLELPEETGYAASTMATDGRRVYAIFPTGDLAAFAMDGKQLWTKNLGVPKNPHGHASSLVTWQGQLLVQMDQGEAEQGLSKIYSLDGPSGRVNWQRNRPVGVSWATPMVIEVGGKAQIVTLSVPWVIAYAVQDGTELWRVEGLNNEVTPSPVFAAGLVLAISPNEKLFAIRPDGHGNVTKTHLAWATEDSFPDITSPVCNSESLYTLTTPGLLACFSLKDGKKVWEQDLGIESHASPTLVANRLVVVGTKGTVLVADVESGFKELARTELNDNAFASPAFAQGKMVVRGAKHLICLAPQPKLARND